jgi:uncharacterized linocin/CFP29 family protein
MAEIGWSDAQWAKVNNAVTEAFGKASVAAAFLPCYGPLKDSAEYVRDEHFTDTLPTVKVADSTTLKLFNLTVKVELSSEQVAEEALSSALLAFRRAANTLAQVEDDVVFNGFNSYAARLAKAAFERNINQLHELKMGYRQHAADAMAAAADSKAAAAEAQAASVAHKQLQEAERAAQLARTGLVVVGDYEDSMGLATVNAVPARVAVKAKADDVGQTLVRAVVAAIADLEDGSHPGPFACILGSNVFEGAYTPEKNSLVLPADRITPLLNGPLLRSGQMDKETGIVVSLAGNDIDIVVATPPKVQFLQVKEDAKYLFRVYEKFVLRIKDPAAVQPLGLIVTV